MKNEYKKIINLFVLIIVCFITVGYAAFGDELLISNLVADVRIASDVRVTGVSFVSSENGSVTNLDYDADSVIGNINLKGYNSTVTIQVSVTNFGNTEMGIYEISGLSDNLLKQVSGYILQDKLCDSTGKCSLGSTTTFNITIGYDTYDAVTKEHDIRLDFDFRKMHTVTYTGITNNNYPTSIIDGGNLKFTATSNVPPKIIAFKSSGDRYNYNLYSYVNGVFTFNNVCGDINLKYQEKAYLKALTEDTEFKNATYKTVIDSVQFVDYVDTASAVATYDLSEVSGSKDVVGWITSGNDLYIGSEWKIYGKTFKNYFRGMSGIENISFGNLSTSETTDMYYMFNGCSGLLSLDVSSFDTSKVTDMGRMFQGLSKVTSIDVSGFDTRNVTRMHGMFRDMSSLSSLDVSNFNTEKVTTMYDMFNNVSSITTLDLSNFKTNNVASMYAMFAKMTNLQSLDLSNFNTSKVTAMNDLFQKCSSLTSLNISSFDTGNVTNMMYMFYDVDSLVNLDLSNFNTSKVTNMYGMFNNMNKIESINLSSFNTSNVTTMEWMFHYCSRLISLDLSSFDTSKVTSMNGMFGGMNYVTSIDVSSFDTSNVTNMKGMFAEQWKIKELDLSNFDTSKVTTVRGMFSNSHNLDSIKFNKASFDLVTDYENMFYNTKSSLQVYAKDSNAQTFIQNALGAGRGVITIV